MVFLHTCNKLGKEIYVSILFDLVGTVFVTSFLLMGFNIISAFIVTATVALIIVDMLGMMAFVGISLNAVSLINLVMVSDDGIFVRFNVVCPQAVGISVEFCSHIVRWFVHSPHHSRANDAFVYMGTSVITVIVYSLPLDCCYRFSVE